MASRKTKYVILIPANVLHGITIRKIDPECMLIGLQQLTAGYIELAHIPEDISGVKGLDMVVNSESKILGLPINVRATLLHGVENDYIAGSAVVVRETRDNIDGWDDPDDVLRVAQWVQKIITPAVADNG